MFTDDTSIFLHGNNIHGMKIARNTSLNKAGNTFIMLEH